VAIVNQAGRLVIGQAVLVGPGLSGKTTNLRWLSGRLPRTPFTEFPTRHERTVFFDELPVMEALPAPGWNLAVKFQTVPGQTHAQAARARRVVLRRPDLVVFVADSDERRAAANRLALDEVQGILADVESAVGRVPVIYQYNKQDVDGALPPEDMDALLGVRDATRILAEAVRGVGVLDTLKVSVDRIRSRVIEEYEHIVAGALAGAT
jgi:mutual gliding-motility protein MglA